MQEPINSIESADNNNLVPWNILDVALIIVFYFVLNYIAAITLKYFGFDFKNISVAFIVHIILSMLPVGAIFILIKYYYKDSFIKTLGLSLNKKLSISYIWGGFYLFLLIFIASMIISLLWEKILHAPISNPYSSYGTEKLQAISIIAVFIAPIFEELMFRGFVQPAVCKIFGAFWGVLIVAITFTLLHRQYSDNVVAILVLLSLSLILGFSRVYFNSIIPAIMAHTLNNFMAAIGILIARGS